MKCVSICDNKIAFLLYYNAEYDTMTNKPFGRKKEVFAKMKTRAWLLTHVLPYAPMVTHAVFTAHSLAIEDDTNNHIENWMKTLKRNYFHSELEGKTDGIRAPRLARAHAIMVKGKYLLHTFPVDIVHVGDKDSLLSAGCLYFQGR